MKTGKREKSTSDKGYYVNNAVLLPAVIEAKRQGKVTSELIDMIQMIAERYSRKHNFIGYSFREDMVASAVMNLCNHALKFDAERFSNPFSFYTTAIHNSFLQFLADEKKQRNIRDLLLINAGANPSYNFEFPRSTDSDEGTASLEPSLLDDGLVHPSTQHELNKKRLARNEAHKAPGKCKVYKPKDIEPDDVTGGFKPKGAESSSGAFKKPLPDDDEKPRRGPRAKVSK